MADTDGMRAIFGLSLRGVISPERVIGLALPEDRSKIEAALAAAYDPVGDGVYEAEYRIPRENDGALRWIAGQGQVHFEKGRAVARRVLLKSPDQRAAPEDAIARASAQVARTGEIIPHLRDFVGHGEPDKTYQNLHVLIGKVASEGFADGKMSGPAIELDLTAERDGVVMDPVQIGQVLSNLVRNAREAVGEAAGGRIAISTAVESRDMIQCDVPDNGPGVAESVKERLFEPLTTTKAKGMGAGLSISKSIIEAHYGQIWARSDPWGGTVFSFTLPLAAEESDE